MSFNIFTKIEHTLSGVKVKEISKFTNVEIFKPIREYIESDGYIKAISGGNTESRLMNLKAMSKYEHYSSISTKSTDIYLLCSNSKVISVKKESSSFTHITPIHNRSHFNEGESVAQALSRTACKPVLALVQKRYKILRGGRESLNTLDEYIVMLSGNTWT